jgi:molybdenum cofactor cytidylyltransferase
VGHAIAAGVAERSGASGWLILPGQMPLVRPASLLAVAKSLENHPVVHADHKGRRGYPMAFGAELYSELVMLKAEDDASRLLARYPVKIVDLADPGVLLRVETLEDLMQMRQLAAKGGSA